MFVRVCTSMCILRVFCVLLGEVLNCWILFLYHCKQARAWLTMPLRVNAQNNFQLKIGFSGKSAFHAYYCGIYADPRSVESLAAATSSL